MKYVTFDGNAQLNGRYDSDIHSSIPVGAVEATDELFLRTINEIDGDWKLVLGVITKVAFAAPAAATLIAAAKARINASYDAAVGNLSINYPYGDKEAMWLQEKEARAYQASNAATVPWLDAIAAERVMPKGELATIIVNRANDYAASHGTYTGKQQKLIADINALGASPTQEQLDAIVWPS